MLLNSRSLRKQGRLKQPLSNSWKNIRLTWFTSRLLWKSLGNLVAAYKVGLSTFPALPEFPGASWDWRCLECLALLRVALPFTGDSGVDTARLSKQVRITTAGWWYHSQLWRTYSCHRVSALSSGVGEFRWVKIRVNHVWFAMLVEKNDWDKISRWESSFRQCWILKISEADER